MLPLLRLKNLEFFRLEDRMSHVQWYITLSEILLLISVLFGIDFRRGTRDIQREGEEIGEVGEEKPGKKS